MNKLELYLEKKNGAKATMFYGVVTVACFTVQTEGDKKTYQIALYNRSIRVCLYTFNYFPDTLLNQIEASKVETFFYDLSSLSLEDQQEIMEQNKKS